jgi:hypothetical protein
VGRLQTKAVGEKPTVLEAVKRRAKKTQAGVQYVYAPNLLILGQGKDPRETVLRKALYECVKAVQEA